MLNTDESFSLEGQKDSTSTTQTCQPHFKACGKESTILHEAKRHQRVNLVEEWSEEPTSPTLHWQSSSASEGQQGHILLDSDEKRKISCICEKASGNVQECNHTVEKPLSCPVDETTPSHKKNINSHQRTHAEEGCFVKDQKQSTSLQTVAELHETKRSAPCQTVCRNTCLYKFIK